jgi:hypothetical protein
MRRLVPDADEQQRFQQSVLDDMVAYTLQMHRSMVIQLTILVGFLMVYHTTQQNCGKNVHQAYQNAASIISTEHALGIDFEPKLQQWLLPHTIISKFFDHYYAIMHFSVTAWTAGWLVIAGADPWYQHRGSFCWTLVLALIGYWSFPTMPPRLIPQYHAVYLSNSTTAVTTDDTVMTPWFEMVDTLHEKGTTYDKLMESHGNPYAAMPSMHTGWALWCALVAYDAAWNGWVVKALFGHFVLIMFATVVSANHYLMDLMAGITCTLIGRFVAARLVSMISSRWPQHDRQLVPQEEDDQDDDDVELTKTPESVKTYSSDSTDSSSSLSSSPIMIEVV